MIVLCTGPESSGTQLLTRLVAALGVEVIHRSIPHDGDWCWPGLKYERAVVIVRDFHAASRAQVGATWSADPDQAAWKLQRAIQTIAELKAPWTLVTYANLVARPEAVLASIACFLGVATAPVSEDIFDADAKWYEGAS